MMCSHLVADKITISATFPVSIEPWEWPRSMEAAELMVAALSASGSVIFILTQARFITKGIERMWALGLKSLPRATGTPVCVVWLCEIVDVSEGSRDRE